MLPPESSPVHQLVHPWWIDRRTAQRSCEIPALREALAAAALDELRAHTRIGKGYCPFSDHRLLWAAAWLSSFEGVHRIPVCPDLTARASWNFDRPSLAPCGKDLAVGST